MSQHIHTVADSVIVALCGPERPPVKSIASMLGARSSKICLVKPASDATKSGFQVITEPEWGQLESEYFDIYADGLILTEPRTAAVFFTADCPTVIILVRLKNGQIRTVIVHAGRAAMTPAILGNGEVSNIITMAYAKLMKGIGDVSSVHAYITGAICGHCFLHDQAGAEIHTRPFKQVFGDQAFIDTSKGTLDLVRIIKRQLVELGITEDKIEYDDYCTFGSDWLASYRRIPGTTERNAIVVVLK